MYVMSITHSVDVLIGTSLAAASDSVDADRGGIESNLDANMMQNNDNDIYVRIIWKVAVG